MKICIDCRMLGLRPHGIARYAHNLLWNLSEQSPQHTYFALMQGREAESQLPKRDNVVTWFLNCPLYGVREQVSVPIALRRMRADLFHSPTFSAPLLAPCPMIMTIHDLIHVIYQADYSFRHRVYYKSVVKRAAHQARKVITVSEASKRDLIRYLSVPESKIVVIPNGVNPICHRLSDREALNTLLETKWGIKGPFLLWVGNAKPHKNLGTVLHAFRRFIAADCAATRMVVVGVNCHEAFTKLGDKSLLEGVCFIPLVSDRELWELYSAAAAFIYPSRYEGFGFPPLEAMACGCPVITSKVSSLPEVVGDAAILVDPDDVKEIAVAIKRVLTDTGIREEMRRKGLERAKLFSWTEAACKTLKVYEEVDAQGTFR